MSVIHDAIARRMLLEQAKAHPFHRDPRAWLAEHAKHLHKAFNVSADPVTDIMEFCIDGGIVVEPKPGRRFLRTPGSGILRSFDTYEARIKTYILAVGADETKVRYVANCHRGCGACKLYCAQEHRPADRSDEEGRDAVIQRVDALKRHGFHAEYGTQVPLEEMDRPAHYHPALCTIIDGTGGRLHNHRLAGLPDSFVVSTLDPIEAADAALLSLKLASGELGYSDALDRYTLLLFTDDRHPDFVNALEARLQPLIQDLAVALQLVKAQAPAQ